jgi:nickel/cobalt exporter
MTTQGEYLAQLLRQGELSATMVLFALGAAFALGAMHALSPGHGKTIVAAYLVGTRGAFRHAAILGGVVTITHTASVFALGLTTLFLSQYVLPEKIVPVLGAISGGMIVWVGAGLLWHRVQRLRGHFQAHDHAHVPEDVSMGSLIALAVSGGLAPCPSALVLLLSSIAIGRVALGLLLLVGFSAGLALVLIAIGAMVLYAKHWLPDSGKLSQSRTLRLLPVFSAALIVCVGVLMTGMSLGWIRV